MEMAEAGMISSLEVASSHNAPRPRSAFLGALVIGEASRVCRISSGAARGEEPFKDQGLDISDSRQADGD